MELEKKTCSRCKKELTKVLNFNLRSNICKGCMSVQNKKSRLARYGTPGSGPVSLSFAFKRTS